MSDPYEKAKAGRLTFKGGSLASRKSIDKKKKKTNKKKNKEEDDGSQPSVMVDDGDTNGPVVFTIDPAKNMKYEELFPVETKKFGYDPKATAAKTVEDILDDRVKKKADRYCK